MISKPLIPLLAALAGVSSTLLAFAAPSPVGQQVLVESPHVLVSARCDLSEWSRTTKKDFLKALHSDQALGWTIVLGNEGGDTDSMAAAVAWAYHLTHLDPPQKAVAILQTEDNALDLRPENKLVLNYSGMDPDHSDLLTIDELPVKPFDLWHRIKGISLVDHNVPRTIWSKAPVLSIIDHHEDRGVAPSASPRLIAPSASCASLVTNIILGDREKGKFGKLYDELPKELVDLLLRTIALDSHGLKRRKRQAVDVESAARLLPMSSWRGSELRSVMRSLATELKATKKALGELDVRDLLRRDWKSDSIKTKSTRYHTLSLGFASVPVSLERQILRTPEATTPEWFAIERAYTSEAIVDVSVILTSYHDDDGIRTREIALIVAHGWGRNLNKKAAEDLFRTIKLAIEDSEELGPLQEWKRPDGKELLPRRAVWKHMTKMAGRKVLRPIIEAAVRDWHE